MMKKIKQFLGYVAPGVIRPLRILWNEVFGFVFVIFGVVFGYRTILLFRDREGEVGELAMLIGGALFSLMFLWFGVTQFLRARKISRS